MTDFRELIINGKCLSHFTCTVGLFWVPGSPCPLGLLLVIPRLTEWQLTRVVGHACVATQLPGNRDQGVRITFHRLIPMCEAYCFWVPSQEVVQIVVYPI